MLANPDVISAEEVLFIFANIEDLLAVHVKFLKYMDDLFVSSDVAQIGAPLGSLFLQFAPAMKIYSTYCNNYFIGHATLERAKDRKTFASWLKVRILFSMHWLSFEPRAKIRSCVSIESRRCT
jgi:hypothetical protein